MIEVRIPKMGMALGGVGVTSVFVSPGDVVAADQPVAEVEGDKASFEVMAGVAGTVVEVLVKAGLEAQVGDVLVRIEAGTNEKSEEPDR